MYTDISIEQRSHDLALQITTLIYQRDNLPLEKSADYFEFACTYRSVLKAVRDSISEGCSDL